MLKNEGKKAQKKIICKTVCLLRKLAYTLNSVTYYAEKSLQMLSLNLCNINCPVGHMSLELKELSCFDSWKKSITTPALRGTPDLLPLGS